MALTDVVFVSRLGPTALSVIGVANVLWTFLFYLLMGFLSSLDTLGSQALGAHDAKGLRAWTLVAALVSLCLCCPLGLFLAFCAGPLALHGLGVSADTAEAVGLFCARLVPGLVPAALTVVAQKYLTIRKVTAPVAAVAVASLLLNVALNQLLIHDLGLGIAGSPLATSISRCTQFLLLLGYCLWDPSGAHGEDCFEYNGGNALENVEGVEGGFKSGRSGENTPQDSTATAMMTTTTTTTTSAVRGKSRGQDRGRGSSSSSSSSSCHFLVQVWKESLQALRNYQRQGREAAGSGGDDDDSDSGSKSGVAAAVRRFCALGCEGAVMMSVEGLSFDVTVLAAATLGVLPLDAHTLLLNVCGWTYVSGPLAFGIAASVRVGTELGAARPLKAQRAAQVAFLFSTAWMVGMAALLFTYKRGIAEFLVGARRGGGDNGTADSGGSGGEGGGGTSGSWSSSPYYSSSPSPSSSLSPWRSSDPASPPEEAPVDRGAVVDLVCKLAVWAALFQVFDGVLGVAGGVLRGCGRQRLVAKVNVATLWGVGVCLGLFLTFPRGLGVAGLWLGLASGVASGGVATSAAVALTDWPAEVVRAKEASLSAATNTTATEEVTRSPLASRSPPPPNTGPSSLISTFSYPPY